MNDVPLHKRIRKKVGGVSRNINVRLGGTAVTEKEWQSKTGDEAYWQTVDHPHRNKLVAAVASFSPGSVLEVGCNSGPNLYRLAKAISDSRLVGIDLNQNAITRGNERFRELGMVNVELRVGKADDLQEFKDVSFDVVFSDAVMIYVGKDKIDRVIDEMLRVAKKGVVLIEWHQEGTKAKGKYLYNKGYWIRDYTALLDERLDVKAVKTTSLTREDWDDDCWGRYGHVIEAVKEQ